MHSEIMSCCIYGSHYILTKVMRGSWFQYKYASYLMTYFTVYLKKGHKNYSLLENKQCSFIVSVISIFHSHKNAWVKIFSFNTCLLYKLLQEYRFKWNANLTKSGYDLWCLFQTLLLFLLSHVCFNYGTCLLYKSQF